LYNTSVGRPNQSSAVIILDDDLPALTIEDVTVKEVDRGVLVQVFVTASSVSSVPISVNFATSDDTAVSGTDYQALTAIITSPAGGIRTSITFNILDDSLYEAMEMFRVVLSAPVHATLAKANGTIQITDNDLMPYSMIRRGPIPAITRKTVFTPIKFGRMTSTISWPSVTVQKHRGICGQQAC